jgi:DNA-binding NarL/FixJ family response regulator
MMERTDMENYSIVLADDHVMFRQGIKSILDGVADLEVVGEVSDGLRLLDVVKEFNPNMVIVDISMPNMRGIEATREIKTIAPEMKVLMLTMHKSKQYLYHAIAAGAEGYLLKEDADTELFAAIEKIRQGGRYVSPLMSGQLAHELAHMEHEGRVRLFNSLSVREREVLKLVAEGRSSKEIADLLFVSVRTIEHHRANIMKKLNIRRTANLVKYAILKGYTSDTPQINP